MSSPKTVVRRWIAAFVAERRAAGVAMDVKLLTLLGPMLLA